MIRPLILLFCFLGYSVAIAFGQAITSETDTLQGESSVITPDDLLRSIPQWDITTTDGFTYLVNSGNYGFYGPQPAVYIDDIPIDFSFIGWQNINSIPVSVEDVNAITYGSSPQVYNNHFAKAGYINFKTAPSDSGFSISSSVGLFNKIEDPGPWAYDSTKVTPNVDRWGINFSSQISYRKEGWLTEAFFSYREHQPTTLINNPRNALYYPIKGKWYPIKTRIFNGLGKIGYTYNDWSISGRVIQSDNIDFIFFHPFGREIPAHPIYRQYAFDGSYQNDRYTFKVRYLGDQKVLKYRINRSRYNFGWRQFEHTVTISGSYQNSEVQLKAGGTYETGITQASAVGHYHKSIYSVFGKAKKRLGQSYWLSSAFDFAFTGDDVVPTISLGSRYHFVPFWDLSASVRYTELIPYEQENSSYWINRGYTLFSDLSIPYKSQLSSKRNRLLSLKFKNNFRIAQSIQAQVAGRYIRNIALNVPWGTFGYDKITATVPEQFEYTSEYGDRFILNAGFTHVISKSITQQVNGKAQYITGGSKRYYRYWRQVPDYSLNYTVRYHPVLDVLFSAKLNFQNSTKWWEFQKLDGKKYYSVERPYRRQSKVFDIQTPHFFNISITAKKWFWNRKLTTTFSIRNLLNNEVRMHPLGTDLKFRFMIKAALKI